MIRQHHCPKLEEVVFPGLLVQEGWLLRKPRTTLFMLASATLLLSVALAWLVFRDWATAWQVGGCCLTLEAFICTYVYQTVTWRTRILCEILDKWFSIYFSKASFTSLIRPCLSSTPWSIGYLYSPSHKAGNNHTNVHQGFKVDLVDSD